MKTTTKTKTILIVDDQPGIRLLLKALFKQASYRTKLASTGEEALRSIEQEQPDCMILDLKMPKMDGVALLQNLRARNIHIPTFIMTAYENTKQIEEVEKLGVIKSFIKPFDIFTIQEEVNALF